MIVEHDADLLLGRTLLAGGPADIAYKPFGRCLGVLDFGLMLHSSGGHDEPETLRYSSRQFRLIGADVGHLSASTRASHVPEVCCASSSGFRCAEARLASGD
jgi:hypothetical protein